MKKGFKEIPCHDRMEINLVKFVCENGVIVFPTFLNAIQEILDSISIFQPIEPGSVNQLIIQCLCRHVIFNFILFFNDVGFGESVGELGSLVDLVEIIVIETVDVESLGF